MFDFRKALRSLDTEFSSLLQIDLMCNYGDLNSTAIGKQIKKAFDYNTEAVRRGEEAMYKRRDQEYLKLTMLLRNLKYIQSGNPDLLRKLGEKLKDANDNNYFGTRLEIQISAFLMQHRITIIRYEKPDFQLSWNDCPISIECTNTHYDAPKYEVYERLQKIGYAISQKAAKPYAALNTVVFIDVTNIHAYSTDEKNLFGDTTTVPTYLQSEVQNTRLGSVVLFTYQYDQDKHEWAYYCAARADHSDIDSHLCEFLDTYFGTESNAVYNLIVPYQG